MGSEIALVEWTAQLFGLAATRNPASKRPSSAHLAIALRRKGIPLGERRVNAIYGSLDRLVAKLYATIPPI
jgi:hypothetical protein